MANPKTFRSRPQPGSPLVYLICMEQENKLTAGEYEGIISVQRMQIQPNTHENAHKTWFICFFHVCLKKPSATSGYSERCVWSHDFWRQLIGGANIIVFNEWEGFKCVLFSFLSITKTGMCTWCINLRLTKLLVDTEKAHNALKYKNHYLLFYGTYFLFQQKCYIFS